MKKRRNISGFSVLVSVVMVSAIAMSIGISLMFSSSQELKNTEIFQSSIGARALNNACVEEALEKLRHTNGEATEGTLTLGGYTCQYTIASEGGPNTVITATSIVGNVNKTTTITVSGYLSDIAIVSWIES